MRLRKPTCFIPTPTALALGAVVWATLLVPACVLAADQNGDRERKARAALALSGTLPAAPAVGAAPMPRVAAKLPYSEGYKRAAADEVPLVDGDRLHLGEVELSYQDRRL